VKSFMFYIIFILFYFGITHLGYVRAQLRI
jgi:hypothetical protein